MVIEKTSLGAEGKAPSHPPSETTQSKGDSDVTASTHGAASNDLAVESTTLDAVGAKQLGKARKICLGVVMAMTYFLASASNSAVVLVIPRISRDLQISDLASQWVVSAFTLANGCSLLVAGRFADIYGRKHLYLLGMSINAVFSLAAAFVRQRIAMCVLRAFAGAGQAIAMPAAFGIVGVSFIDEHERTIAFALMGMGFPVGGALGQVIGGVIAGASTRAWQYIFVLLSGIAFLSVIAGVIIIPFEPKKTAVNDRRVDWVGAILVTASLGAFSFSITQGGLVREGWKAAYIPVVFVISLVIMSTFVAWEYYVMKRTTFSPLVHLRLFQRHGHRVAYVLLTALTAYIAINGWVYFTTIWYQNLKGLSSMQNALYVLPAPIVGIFACAIVPPLAKRVKAPYLLFFGGFMTAAACWLFAVQPYPGTSYWACEFIANIANPFGADFTVGIGSVLISNLAAKHEQSLLGALFQTVLQLSGTIGICLCSLVQEIVYRDTGDLHKALTTVCWMMAGFAWSSCIIVVVTLRRVGLAKDVTKLD